MGFGSMGQGLGSIAWIANKLHRASRKVRALFVHAREWVIYSRYGGLLAPTLVVLGAVAIAACCAGCGASAVRAHAVAATTATVALASARTLILEETDAAIAACDTAGDRAACLDRARTLALGWGSAHDFARLALIGWREAIEVAAIADDDGDLWGPLGLALLRFAREWNTLHAISPRIPMLPPQLLELAEHASGGDDR